MHIALTIQYGFFITTYIKINQIRNVAYTFSNNQSKIMPLLLSPSSGNLTFLGTLHLVLRMNVDLKYNQRTRCCNLKYRTIIYLFLAVI